MKSIAVLKGSRKSDKLLTMNLTQSWRDGGDGTKDLSYEGQPTVFFRADALVILIVRHAFTTL
jgi:hypothetical protein